MALTSPSGTGSAQVEQDTGDELTIAVASSGAAFLVVADTWFPGWSAVAVDRQRRERPLEIVRAMGWQRAVAVDADVVRVVFRYRPGSWPLGVCMSLLGLTGLMVLAFCSRRGVASAAPASTGS